MEEIAVSKKNLSMFLEFFWKIYNIQDIQTFLNAFQKLNPDSG